MQERGPSKSQVDLWLVVQPAQGAECEVSVEAPPTATVEDLTAALANYVGDSRPGPGLFSRRAQAWLPRSLVISDSGLRSGDALVLGSEGVTTDWNAEASRHLYLAHAELLVAGGPGAGARFPLSFGDHVVGREAEIAINDPSLSRRHFRLTVTPSAVTVTDVGSLNGTSVEGSPLDADEAMQITDEAIVEAGRSLFTIRRSRQMPGLSVSRSGVTQIAGRVPFNRKPRVEQPWSPQTISIEPPPDDAQRARLPLATALAPIVVGGALFALTRNVLMVAFMALAPIMAVFSVAEAKRSGLSAFKRQSRDFERRFAETRELVKRALAEEVRARRSAAPSAFELLERALDYRDDLWERRPEHDDFLLLRLGTGTLPAQTTITSPTKGNARLRDEAQELADGSQTVAAVPVSVALREIGALGVCGARSAVDALGRWLIVQTAVLHSPRDVVIAAAISPDALDEWSWLKWLPHTHSETSPLSGRHLASSGAEMDELLESLRSLVDARRQQASAHSESATAAPVIVCLIDERLSPSRPLITELLRIGPKVGVYTTWLGSRSRDVPGDCEAVVELARDVAKLELTLTKSGDRIADVTADGVPIDVAREAALALAPVRDASTADGRQETPRHVSLFELLTEQPTALSVVERWQTNSSDRSTILGADGRGPVRVDLRRDGPHGLVAGTTRAGKSELLQTLVAGLALEHPPTRLTFLLIDYKGGTAFSSCVQLPHTVGLVTDLDTHLTRRALVSLNAELRYREAVLREANAPNLTEMELTHPDTAPPSLLIIIDEFAALKREMPEFVEGIVDVAQRGAALGVHLILATQHPGGVVDEKIKANTNLRIALRVNTTSESRDVVAADDAAAITRDVPGRAVIRTGPGELRTFQSAYVGGSSAATRQPAAIAVHELAFDAQSASQEHLVALPAGRDKDLRQIVDACNAAADTLRVPPPRRPWVEPLNDVVPITDLPPSRAGVAVVGVVDEPAHQRQRPYEIDLDHAGSVLVFGASGTGKTTFLLTTAVALAADATPDNLHIYGLDFASRMLTALEPLPHCAGVVTADDQERVVRLFAFLRNETARRKELFSASGVYGFGSYAAQSSDPLARILVLLDGYSGFVDAYDKVNLGEYVELLPRLVADGRPLGIHFILTADRRAAVPGTLTSIIPRKIVLRMAADDDYAALGLDPRAIRGADLPPGRAFVEGTLEMQASVVSRDPAAEAQARSIVERSASATSRAPQLGVLPTNVPEASLPRTLEPLQPILGIGDDDLEPISISLVDGHFIIGGPLNSGRSTALAAIGASIAASGGADLALLCPRRSPLPDMSCWNEIATTPETAEALASKLAKSATEARSRPLVVIVDDCDLLAEGPAATALDTIVQRGRDTGIRVVAAGTTQTLLRAYSPWLRELRKDEQGLLLTPQPEVDGELLGVRLPRRPITAIPGRAYLVSAGAIQLVQIASLAHPQAAKVSLSAH